MVENQIERDFKGVWIPKEIWLAEDLSWTEKILLVEIDSLAKNDECFATNEHFAQFLHLKKDTVSKAISSLKNKGYIEITLQYREGTKEIIKRIINPIPYRKKILEGIGKKSDTPIGKKSYDNNTNINNTNNNTESENAREALLHPPSKKQTLGYFKNVFLTDEEIEKLKSEFPDDYLEKIERLSEHMESKGEKYNSHFATLRAWLRRDEKALPQSPHGFIDFPYEFDALKAWKQKLNQEPNKEFTQEKMNL